MDVAHNRLRVLVDRACRGLCGIAFLPFFVAPLALPKVFFDQVGSLALVADAFHMLK